VTDAGTIKVVAALISDDAGRVLLVRKRGTTAFMQPGGKRDAGEDDIGLSASSTPLQRMNPAGGSMLACMGSM
jgi:8-oxo-dGTP pyrophosphatase MutT (NUDIX family)